MCFILVYCITRVDKREDKSWTTFRFNQIVFIVVKTFSMQHFTQKHIVFIYCKNFYQRKAV